MKPTISPPPMLPPTETQTPSPQCQNPPPKLPQNPKANTVPDAEPLHQRIRSRSSDGDGRGHNPRDHPGKGKEPAQREEEKAGRGEEGMTNGGEEDRGEKGADRSGHGG
ncbi:hypothetical protein QQ045_015231 [Rhodiola kirilowii]